MDGARKTSFAQLSDEQLIQRVRDDRASLAFEVLYQRHSTRAMSCALHHLFDRDLARDAVQAAFLDVWRGSSSYSPYRGPVSAWIAGITAHRAVDIQRRVRTQERAATAMTTVSQVWPHPHEPVDAVIERDRDAHWRAGVDDLPDAQREVITLAYFGGLSHTEIASRLSLPLGTVKGRVRLGLHHLRDRVACDPASFA